MAGAFQTRSQRLRAFGKMISPCLSSAQSNDSNKDDDEREECDDLVKSSLRRRNSVSPHSKPRARASALITYFLGPSPRTEPVAGSKGVGKRSLRLLEEEINLGDGETEEISWIESWGAVAITSRR